MSLRSPRKNHTIKFLKGLIDHDFIAKDGTEFSEEETRAEYFRKCSESSERRAKTVYKRRCPEEKRDLFPLSFSLAFSPESFEKDSFPLKERLTVARFCFTN